MIQKTLSALCDPTRREILKLLKRGAHSAGEISERFDVSAPAISRHLAVLRDAELVEVERDGKRIIYRLNPTPLEDILYWIKNIFEEE